MNLNNQQKLLSTPLFTSPSVLFPDFFTIASTGRETPSQQLRDQ
ncbi:hypothetical protein [Nostoc sp.]